MDVSKNQSNSLYRANADLLYNSYPSSEAPEYHPGSSVSLTAALIVAIAPIVIVLMLRRANKLRAQRREELGPEMSSPIGPMNDKDIRYEYIY